MGESALLVWFGARLDMTVNERVHRLAGALRRAELHGVVDIVPAASSLLVSFEPRDLPEEHLRAKLRDLLSADLPPSASRHAEHVVPTAYGGEYGPDLEGVASYHGLTAGEVVSLHTSRTYRVMFLGFLPGFAYMGLTHRGIAIPRLDVPRVRVPAGSVGLAGRQTGIYPFSSPGGWRLIGRTALRLWDPFRPSPALLAPGDLVRFVPVPGSEVERAGEGWSPASPASPPARPVFEVLEPGALTSVQDLGRPGLGHLGVCRGGAFDREAACRANALVGNPLDAAVLELTWTGPVLKVLCPTTIALEGAGMTCIAGSEVIPPGVSWFVRAGTVLRFVSTPPLSAPSTRAQGGVRICLAIAGGLDVPVVLGSRATYLPAGFGGYEGRALRSGDLLGSHAGAVPPAAVAGRFWPQARPSASEGEVHLRFVPCEGPWAAPRRAVEALTSREWVIGAQSDRMGTRLVCSEGPPIHAGRGELLSFGVVQGAIQLPPGGSPLVLNVDHQTTGGYPLAGVVIRADQPLMANLAPGQTVRFDEVTVSEARAIHAQKCADFAKALRLLRVGREVGCKT